MHSFVSFKGKVQTDLRFTIQWQIQRIEYGLNDTIRIKKTSNIDTLLIRTLSKKKVQKKFTPL